MFTETTQCHWPELELSRQVDPISSALAYHRLPRPFHRLCLQNQSYITMVTRLKETKFVTFSRQIVATKFSKLTVKETYGNLKGELRCRAWKFKIEASPLFDFIYLLKVFFLAWCELYLNNTCTGNPLFSPRFISSLD